MARHPGRERGATGSTSGRRPEHGAATKVAAALLAACAVALLPLFLRGDAGATGGWSSVASMSQSRAAHTATTLDDGRVLVAGGHAPPIPPSVMVTPLTATEIYAPATNTWSPGPPITHPRYDASAVKLNDGRLLLVGGYVSNENVSDAEIYDPIANTWSPAGSPTNLDSAVGKAVLFTNGDVFVAGQRLAGGQNVGATAWFHPTTNTWTAGPDIPVTSAWPVTLPDETVLVTGWGLENAAVVVPPGVNTTPEMPAIKEQHTLTVFPDSRVLLAGNAGSSYVYTPSTGTFALAPAIPNERTMHTANSLQNGLVLIAGGHGQYPGNFEPWDIYTTAYTFDWNAGTWAATGAMNTPRYRHASAMLFDGRVLVTGGNVTDSALTASAEVFDLAAAPTPVPTHTPTSTPTPAGPTATFTSTPDGTPTFTPTPGLPTATFTPTSTPDPSAQPDLIITEVKIEHESGGGACFQIPYLLSTKVTIKNNGSGSTGGFFYLHVNGIGVVNTALAAGESRTWYVAGYATGTTNITVDTTNLIAESIESNNTFSAPVPIPTPPLPCTPTSTPDPNVTPTPTATHTLTSTPTHTPTSQGPPGSPTGTPINTPVPCLIDTDDDYNNDCLDNCPAVPNNDQLNSDAIIIQQPGKVYNDTTRARSDGLGNVCDDDDDNDGLSDAVESAGPPCAAASAATSAIVADSDGDRVIDGAECQHGTSPNDPLTRPVAPCNNALDVDLDGVLDGREACYYGTSSAAADSDGDGCSDAREVASINLDLTVNATDLGQMAQSFGTYPAPPLIAAPHLVNFDTDKNGSISAMDLAFVARNFGSC